MAGVRREGEGRTGEKAEAIEQRRPPHLDGVAYSRITVAELGAERVEDRVPRGGAVTQQREPLRSRHLHAGGGGAGRG